MIPFDQPNEGIPADDRGDLEGALLLDVRGPDEFAAGHLDGALNVPVDEIGQRLTELGPKEQPVAVYCRSGRRSAAAALLLRDAGFVRVTDLGGLNDLVARRLAPNPSGASRL